MGGIIDFFSARHFYIFRERLVWISGDGCSMLGALDTTCATQLALFALSSMAWPAACVDGRDSRSLLAFFVSFQGI
ncbi:hypothetical protein VTL71DRAFT_3880 [Oculimacula yallundae]|uniref:Uncharacterized protein n=1 Tax=Oculimacula yallundae TaxID=86028 RepID=A0ABR4C5G1_9HELO